jgi:hypothetical protein
VNGPDAVSEPDPPRPTVGVAVAPATAPVGVGSIVGLGLAGAEVSTGGVAAADAVAAGGVDEGALDGGADGAGALAAGLPPGEAAPPCGAVADGRAAVSPPGVGDDVGGPNAPTASAIAARVRFRIPRATTSRAR